MVRPTAVESPKTKASFSTAQACAESTPFLFCATDEGRHGVPRATIQTSGGHGRRGCDRAGGCQTSSTDSGSRIGNRRKHVEIDHWWCLGSGFGQAGKGRSQNRLHPADRLCVGGDGVGAWL